ERLQAPGTILRPVDGERADGRRRGIHALLQRVQGGIAIARMKRVPIVAERGRYYAGLAKGALDALHFLPRRHVFRRGVAPPALQKDVVVGGHRLLGEGHLEEVRVPDTLEPFVAERQLAARSGGMCGCQGDDLLHTLRREGGGPIRRRGSPVVPYEK